MTMPLAIFLSVGSMGLWAFIAVAAWSDNQRKEREAFYRSETLKKLAESETGLALFREEERLSRRRRRDGQKLAGMITIAVGIGMMILLGGMASDKHAYLVGVVPALVGCAMLLYSFYGPTE